MFLVQEHNAMTQPGLKPRPLNPDASSLTIRQTNKKTPELNAKMRSVNKREQSLVKFVNIYFLLHEKELLPVIFVSLNELSHILLTRSSFIV